MSARLLVFVLAALSQVVWLRGALAQLVPVGPEFQVNSYTTDDQGYPAVAASDAGNFVVVWGSYGSAGSDTMSSSVQGQRYDAAGNPVGGEFQVNSYTTSSQRFPDVAIDAAGNFVVVWGSYGSAGSDTSDGSIQGQRYNAAGSPVGGEFQVNSYTTGNQGQPNVAIDGAGNFVVVWHSLASSESNTTSIQGQRYDAAGNPLGLQFLVNSNTTYAQFGPDVAANAAGNFVVVWESYGSAGSDTSERSIQGQRYNAAGNPVGGQFQVNTYTTGFQLVPKVAIDAAGNFLVVWSTSGNGSDDTYPIQGRRYDAAGNPVGGEVQVNTYTTGDQYDPDVAADATGNFTVSWTSVGSPGTDTFLWSIQGRRYDSAGSPVGAQFQVNSYTTHYQLASAVAMDAAGNFIVTWGSFASPGSDLFWSRSIQGQRFSPLPPTDLLTGRITTIKPGTRATFVAKPATGETFALPSSDPVTAGGSLRIFDVGATAGDNTYALPAAAAPLGWKGLGNPAGSKGYRYKGAGSPADPCKVVLVRQTVMKAVCKGAGVTLAPPFTGDIGIVLALGSTDRYCAQFGGDTVKNDAAGTKRKNAPAPAACP